MMNFQGVILIAMFICGCDGRSTAVSEGKGTKSSSVSGEVAGSDERCLRVVRAYVRSKKGWNDEDYRIVQEQLSGDSRGFSVRHEDDEIPLPVGGLKSFHLDLDRSCNTVKEELTYQ